MKICCIYVIGITLQLLIVRSQSFNNYNDNLVEYKSDRNERNLSNIIETPDFPNTSTINVIIKDLIRNKLNSTNFSEQCNKTLNDLINSDKNDLSIIFTASSKIINNIINYPQCMNLPNNNIKYFYSIIKFTNSHEVGSIFYETGQIIIGLCFPADCNENDVREFYNNSISDLGLSDISRSKLKVFTVQNEQKKYTLLNILLLYLIPFYILIIMLIFAICPQVPGFIFIEFFKEKKLIDSDSVHNLESNGEKKNILEKVKTQFDDNSSNTFTENESNFSNNSEDKKSNSCIKYEYVTNKQKLNKFIQCFIYYENPEEVFETSYYNFYTNDSGLKSIRFIRVFFLANSLLGFVFYTLLDSPIKIYHPNIIFKILKSALMCYLNFCLKLCPKVLLSLTGYSLTYKFLCYLEKRRDELNYRNVKIENDINFKDYLSFFNRFLYKFVIYLLISIFWKFSLIIIVSLGNPGPMLIYFKQNVIMELETFYDWINYLLSLLMIDYFFQLENISVDTFWYTKNEMIFFILLSLLIYHCFKKNLRLDLFLIISVVLLLLLKIIIFFIFEISDSKVYSLAILNNSKRGFLAVHPLFNIDYFCIGCFYGICNYIIQKSLTLDDLKGKDNNHLKLAFYFTQFLRRNSVKLIFLIIFSICFLIYQFFSLEIALLSSGCYLNEENYDCLEDLRNVMILRLFEFLKKEFNIAFLFFLYLKFMVLQSNFISKFLSHDMWTTITRSIFSFNMLGALIINFVIYQSESRISINPFNILFFFIFSLKFTIVVSVVSHAILEIPLKKLNNFISIQGRFGRFNRSGKSTIYNHN